MVLAAIFLQIAPRADDVLELITDDHPRPLGAGTAVEQHDAGTGIGEGRLRRKKQRTHSQGGRNQVVMFGEW